jgi:hypothetical protein
MQMKATWYQYIEISSFCKGNFASKSNELTHRKRRGVGCHSALDTESRPVFWIPAGVYPHEGEGRNDELAQAARIYIPMRFNYPQITATEHYLTLLPLHNVMDQGS